VYGAWVVRWDNAQRHLHGHRIRVACVDVGGGRVKGKSKVARPVCFDDHDVHGVNVISVVKVDVPASTSALKAINSRSIFRTAQTLY
jgi:hypothetical protein